MDKKFVKRKINEVFGRYEYKELLERIAEAIVAQHEEELAKMEHRYQQANQMDRDIAGMARLDMEKAQAQVAVMRQALAEIKNAIGEAWTADHKIRTNGGSQADQLDQLIERLGDCSEKAGQALSASPKVMARLKMQLRREPMGDRYLEATGQDSYLAMGKLRYGETYDVLVMTGEQGQNSEQGE